MPDLRKLLETLARRPGELRRHDAALREHALDRLLLVAYQSPELLVDDELLLRFVGARTVAEAEELHPAVAGRWQAPPCLTGQLPVPLRNALRPGHGDLPPVVLYRSRPGDFRVQFSHELPVVRDGEDRLLRQLSSRHARGLHIVGGREALLEPTIELPRVALIHDHFPPGNYCHWLLDWLPRFALLARAGIDLGDWRIPLPAPLKAFHRQTLAALGVPLEAIVEVDPARDAVRARCLIATSTGGPDFRHACYAGSRWAMDWLRERLLPARPKGDTPRSILLVRRDSRRLRFSERAERMLRERGFEPVSPEQLSVADQAALFAGADRVIAAHGAGLANLVFCRPGTRVLELYSAHPHATNGFFKIATKLDLDYCCAIGDLPPGVATVSKGSDIVVPDRLIEDWFDRID